MNDYVSLSELIKSVSITHRFNKEELVFLNTSDVLEGKILINHYSKVAELKGQAKKSIKNGDILYSEIRPKNKRYAYVRGISNVEDYVVSTKLMVLRNYSKKLETDYLYHFLTSEETIDYLQKRAENRIGSFPQITFNVLKTLQIWLPNIPTQQSIAKVLSDLDEKIELNNRINKALESMAKTLYDYWFVQFDFPNEEGKPYKSSGGKMVYNAELKREIPEGWEVKKFGDIAYQVTESIHPLEYPELPYLPIDKLPMYQLYYSEYENRSEANSSLIRFQENDILLGAMRVYFHRVCHAIEDGISRSTIIVLRPTNQKYKNFVLFTLNKEDSIDYANNNSTGTSIPYAKWKSSLENMLTVIPTKDDLLNTFNVFIEPILNNFKTLNKQNQQLAQLRDWLLPMLMNGQVAVKDVEHH